MYDTLGSSVRQAIKAGSRRTLPRRALAPLPEDDRPVAGDQHAAFEVEPHRAGQHAALELAALAHELGDVVAVAHAADVLLDDGTLVELAGHEMRGRADDLHAARLGLVVGLGADEGGQERVVDVDDAR